MPYLQILAIYFGFLAFGGLLAVLRRWVRPNTKTPSALRKGPIYILLNLIFLVAIWLPRETHSLTLVLAVLAFSVSWEISGTLFPMRTFRLLLSLAAGMLILASDWLSISGLIQLWSVLILLALPIVSLLCPGRAPAQTIDTRKSPDPILHAGPETLPACNNLGPRLLSLSAGLVYLPFCLVPLVWLWHTDLGDYQLTFFYLIIVTNDAFSQFTGQLVGHTPLAPGISPAKTIEGSFGGVLFAALLGASLSSIVRWSNLRAILLAILVALCGQIGDLTESSWKRALGRKDFSSALGAHGGILDRFDALIYAAPVFCLFTSLWP